MGRNKNSKSKRFMSAKLARWCILICVGTIFTLITYPGLVVKKDTYRIGDVAKKDIKAPIDFFVEDKDATEAKQKEAIKKVLTVYDFDTTLVRLITLRVKQAFAESKAFFASYDEKKPSNKQIMQIKKRFEDKIGIPVSIGAYRILIKEQFSDEIADLINRVLLAIFENGVVENKEMLLGENEQGITLRYIGTDIEKTLTNLRHFYGTDQAQTMVRIIGQPFLKNTNYILLNLIVDFCQRLIQPNITLNRLETSKRKRVAAESIKPVVSKIKAGEMLLREGERVTKTNLLKLNALRAITKKEKLITNSLGAAMIFISFIIIIYILQINERTKSSISHNKSLLFLASVFVLFLVILFVSSYISESIFQDSFYLVSDSSILFGIPLASGAMIVCLFLGIDTAASFALILAVCAAIAFKNRFEVFIYFLLSGTMGAYWTQNSRKRNVLIQAGLKLGVLNIVLATAVNVYIADSLQIKILWDLAFAFLGGVVAGILTSGIAPLLETAFDYTTDIKLLELANLDQPILKKLMIEAPGTYHHCVVVGSLVEAAASEIGVNPLFAKVCGYYHDLGKIKKPLYFIENQADGKNKHDKLAPSMSSLILMSHIKDGVEIAKENKLGSRIIDTIRQHHGTSLISYFYEKAKRIKGKDSVNIEDFRYPGPKPQTRVAGLIMLADVVEAASKTLENPTPARIRGHVQNIINKVFSDGQLDECELTLKDLHKIAKSFNQILNGIYHHRIEYPEKRSANGGEQEIGNSDKKQSKHLQVIAEKDRTQSPQSLKRLGMS